MSAQRGCGRFTCPPLYPVERISRAPNSASRLCSGACYSDPGLSGRRDVTDPHPSSAREDPALSSTSRPLHSGRVPPRSAQVSSFLIRDILPDRGESPPVECGESCRFAPNRAIRTQSSVRIDALSSQRRGELANGPVLGGLVGGLGVGARVRRARKARTAFTDPQLALLERSFQSQKYLGVQDRVALAASLDLSDLQVKTWYQNRRTKWKRLSGVVGPDMSCSLPQRVFPLRPDFYQCYARVLYLHEGRTAVPLRPGVLHRAVRHHEPLQTARGETRYGTDVIVGLHARRHEDNRPNA